MDHKMKFAVSIVLILSILVSVSLANKTQTDTGKHEAKDVLNKSQVGILTLRGFKVEVHYAITKDGYHLHLVRIINPALPPGIKLKRPVLFNHGLMESSTIWLINSHGVRPTARDEYCHSLPIDVELAKNSTEFTNTAMMLANNGYDVWLLSMRGTDWSLNHETLDVSSPDFWDYSLDNFALDDIPTAINYVRQITDEPKVAYIGHSQATWSIFSLLATETHYADIIEPVIAVGPFAYMHQTTSVARLFFLSTADVGPSNGPVPESARQIRQALGKSCSFGGLLSVRFGCKLLDALVGGFGEAMPAGYYSHLPYYSSNKVVRHFGQLINSKKYRMYDHGQTENLKRYGTLEPPRYDLGKIRSKSLVLIWSTSDTLTNAAGVEQLIKELKVPLHKAVFIEQDINHFGLITSKDAPSLVNLPILEVLESFSHETGDCVPPPEPLLPLLPTGGNHLLDNLIQHDHSPQSAPQMPLETNYPL